MPQLERKLSDPRVPADREVGVHDDLREGEGCVRACSLCQVIVLYTRLPRL